MAGKLLMVISCIDSMHLFFAVLTHTCHMQNYKRQIWLTYSVSLLGRVAHGVSSGNLLSAQEGEVNRDWGLAAAPHLLRVYGCGRHPITHPYHFAKPAPMSLDM